MQQAGSGQRSRLCPWSARPLANRCRPLSEREQLQAKAPPRRTPETTIAPKAALSRSAATLATSQIRSTTSPTPTAISAAPLVDRSQSSDRLRRGDPKAGRSACLRVEQSMPRDRPASLSRYRCPECLQLRRTPARRRRRGRRPSPPPSRRSGRRTSFPERPRDRRPGIRPCWPWRRSDRGGGAHLARSRRMFLRVC